MTEEAKAGSSKVSRGTVWKTTDQKTAKWKEVGNSWKERRRASDLEMRD
jgi:hypothetical protein